VRPVIPESDWLRVCFDDLNIGEGNKKVNEKNAGEFIFIYRVRVVSRVYMYNEKAKVVLGLG